MRGWRTRHVDTTSAFLKAKVTLGEQVKGQSERASESDRERERGRLKQKFREEVGRKGGCGVCSKRRKANRGGSAGTKIHSLTP